MEARRTLPYWSVRREMTTVGRVYITNSTSPCETNPHVIGRHGAKPGRERVKDTALCTVALRARDGTRLMKERAALCSHLELQDEREAAFGHAAGLDEAQVREVELLAVRVLLAVPRIWQLH